MQKVTALEELDLTQLEAVAGGSSTEWAVSTGTAVALTVGATAAAAPVVAGALAAAGIAAAGMAIYYALTDEEQASAS